MFKNVCSGGITRTVLSRRQCHVYDVDPVRLRQVWQWQNEDGSTREYYDAESFRAAVEEEQLDSDLRALLPRPDGKPIEKPAEAALRQRM